MTEITVKELAECISRPREEISAAIERIKNWTKEGLLTPLGEKNPGTGRHRHYDETALLNALVLTAITDLGIPAVRSKRFVLATPNDLGVPSFRSMKFKKTESPLFQLARRGFEKVGEAAREGDAVFLVCSARPEQDNTMYIDIGKKAYVPEWLESCFVINLTAVLKRSKLQEAING